MTGESGRVGLVLVIDDDPDVREAVRDTLEDEGYRVSVAENGEAALRRLRDGERPTVMLLDLMMPVMDGEQFHAAVMDLPALRDIPIVLMSADRFADEKGSKLGVARTLRKPVRLPDLLDAVETFYSRES